MVALPQGLLIILMGDVIFMSPFAGVVFVNSFLPRTARLWNSLLEECFHLAYDLKGLSLELIGTFNLTLGGVTSVSVHLNWLKWTLFLILVEGLSIILMGYAILVSPFLGVIKLSLSAVSYLAQPDSKIFCLALRRVSFS